MSADSIRGEASANGGNVRQESAQVVARNDLGQYASFGKQDAAPDRDDALKRELQETVKDFKNATGNPSEMSNMLRHIEKLEQKIAQRDTELNEANSRVQKLSQRTREGMQSALDTLMKKWMDAVETNDPNCKTEFKKGMDKLVEKSAEENGVWQMMVAASALHQKQEHNLDELRMENKDLKYKIDGHYATPETRTRNADGKRKADSELDRSDVQPENTGGIWEQFASDMSVF